MKDSLSSVHAVSRRSILKTLGTGALGAASLGTLSSPVLAQSGPGLDAAVLNFALNLEYLEAEFYSYAVTGAGIEAQGAGVNGSGTPGTVNVKSNPQVPFTTPAYEQFAAEIAADEVAHVKFLRAALLAAGVQPVARPAIDLNASFTAAARAAGVIGPTDEFDPFLNEVNFLLAAFIFEDVGVTAYKGGSRLLTNRNYVESAAGILAVEAYHASLIRTVIYQLGATAHDAAQKISDLRDSVDGADDRDQGVVINGEANIVPSDSNGIAFSRTPRQVLNIVYLAENAPSGGFFPNGVNGLVH
ncbi:MAG: ferritin-like domain-containing protein [Verrucomicrobiota bacterium]